MSRTLRNSSPKANTRVLTISDIDRLLLSSCGTRWMKVARLIGHAYDALEARGIKIFRGIAKFMDARLAALVRNGKLEAKGNIKRWRYSEVRLPAGPERRFFTSMPRPATPAGRRRVARGNAAKKAKRVEAAE